MTTRPTYGSAPISDTGLSVPRGISMRIFNLADSTGLTVPSSAWAIPAASQPEKGNGHDQPAPIGHNSTRAQPMADEAEAQVQNIAGKKAYYIEVLTDWFANRREMASECMTPEEIGACENRPALLLHAMAIGIASIYREELFNRQSTESAEERVRGAFAMMGVYVLDTYFANNVRGYSTASAERAAELLGCSVNTVKRARARLVEHRILVGGRKGGHGDRWWPAISRKVGSDPKASVVWLLDATSEPIKRGRPTEIQAPDAGPRLDGEIWTPDAGPRFSEPGKSRPPLQKSRPPDPKSSTRMRGRETLNIRQEDSLGADAPGADATDLFAEGAPDRGGALPDGSPTSGKVALCKPSPSTADIKLAFGLYLETAERCRLPKHERVDPWVPNIRARLRESGLDGWKRMLAKVEASQFLRGEKTNFRADLDWLSGPKNFGKVLSGKYDEQDTPKPKPKMPTRY